MAKAIHMMVRVLDEARSVDFYTKVLGLDGRGSGSICRISR